MGIRRKTKNIKLSVEHYSSQLFINKIDICSNCPLKLYSKENDIYKFLLMGLKRKETELTAQRNAFFNSIILLRSSLVISLFDIFIIIKSFPIHPPSTR